MRIKPLTPETLSPELRFVHDEIFNLIGKSQGQAGFLWYFDHEGDGDVDGLDMAQFNRRRRS